MYRNVGFASSSSPAGRTPTMSHTKLEMVTGELPFSIPYGTVHSRYIGTVKRFDRRAIPRERFPVKDGRRGAGSWRWLGGGEGL